MSTQVEKVMGATMPLIINRYTGVMALACFFPVMGMAIPLGLICVTIGLPIFIPVMIIMCEYFLPLLSLALAIGSDVCRKFL